MGRMVKPLRPIGKRALWSSARACYIKAKESLSFANQIVLSQSHAPLWHISCRLHFPVKLAQRLYEVIMDNLS